MFIQIQEILRASTDLLGVAILLAAWSAAVSAITSILIKRSELRFSLRTEYEHEQRKRLHSLIGRYHGRLLQAADIMVGRLWGVYKYDAEGWLDVGENYGASHDYIYNYFFKSTVYRFLVLYALVRRLEMEALVVDNRIGTKSDVEFVRYQRVLFFAATDMGLFEGLPYGPSDPDHLLIDAFRVSCDACWSGDQIIGYDEFASRLGVDHRFDLVLRFFDGISAQEERLRWDRLVALQIALMSFVNTFGTASDRKYTDEEFRKACAHVRHAEVVKNLADYMSFLGLQEATRIYGAHAGLLSGRLPVLPADRAFARPHMDEPDRGDIGDAR